MTLRLGLGLALAVFASDQATKWAVKRITLDEGVRSITILPFFDIVAAWNYGVSFGMFNDGDAGDRWVFIGIAAAIVTMLLVWLRRAENTLVATGLGLVIGGAIGNVADRLFFGAVFDFLLFHAYGWHWPAFNVADSTIFIGVALLIADSLFGRKGLSKQQA
jgi:signal peptidase II